MLISDLSSDVCSSDLRAVQAGKLTARKDQRANEAAVGGGDHHLQRVAAEIPVDGLDRVPLQGLAGRLIVRGDRPLEAGGEECMGGCGEIYRRMADDEARRFGGQFLEGAPPGVGDLTPGVARD